MSNKEGVPEVLAGVLGQDEQGSSPERRADESTSNNKRKPERAERKEPASKRRATLKVDDSDESTAAANAPATAAAAAAAAPQDERKKPAASAQGGKKKGGSDAAAGDNDDIDEMVDFEKMQFTFPERLMDLLQSGSVEPAMRWLPPHGEAFVVVPKIFYDVVLLCHFQGTKFESFTRKLNRWGFKRLTGKSVPQQCIAYHHPLFKKDKPELLKMMRSGRNKFFVPAEVAGITTRDLAAAQLQQQQAALSAAIKNSPLFDFAAAGKMGPAAGAAAASAVPSAIQSTADLFSNSARTRLAAQLSVQGNDGSEINQRMLDEIRRYQTLQSPQQLLLPPGSLAGLGGSSQAFNPLQREARSSLSSDGEALSLRQLLASQLEQQEQQTMRDHENLRKLLAAQQQEHQNVTAQRSHESLRQLLSAQQREQRNAMSQRSRDNDSLRQLLAAQQPRESPASSQRNSGNNNINAILGNPFTNPDAQQFLASQRTTANDADLRLRQLLSQAAAGPASTQSTQDLLSAFVLQQQQGSSSRSPSHAIAAAAGATAGTATHNTPTDSQLLQLLFLQEEMERNRGGP